jgi:HEAT repeat protein
MDVASLVEVLLDHKHPRWDERDDAAMDLAASDDPAAVRGLLDIGCDQTEADVLLESVGESLAEVLARHPEWRTDELASLTATAAGAFRRWNEASQASGQVL